MIIVKNVYNKTLYICYYDYYFIYPGKKNPVPD